MNRVRQCTVAGCSNGLKGGATKYCSLKCNAQAQKKSRSQCLSGCGNTGKLYRNRYCSIACAHGHRYRCRAEAFFIEGGAHGYVSPQFLARVLRDYYGERCLRCGWSARHAKTGKVPIEVEHIDGNWENNRLTNLTLLCPNCHALTPTYRALNRGRGRAYRLAAGERIANLSSSKRALPRASSQKVFGAPSRQLEFLLPT
jgi:hypothetical protein